jgi:hypothetical protein
MTPYQLHLAYLTHLSNVEASSTITIEILRTTSNEPKSIAVVTISVEECLQAGFQDIGVYP